jgi:transcriptional regulator with XRE-family HTH domain
MSQGDLSHKFGIDRGHVSDLENGKKLVGLAMLETLADGFGITISELMKGV